MALEQTLWFFKLSDEDSVQALEVARALDNRLPPPVPLQPLPNNQILQALKRKFKRLKIDSNAALAEVDLPARETTLTVRWTPEVIEAVFEGDSEKTMEEVAAILAKFHCGTVFGREYYPPAVPYGFVQHFFADVEAESTVFGRISRRLQKQFPGDRKRQQEEMARAWADPVIREEVLKLADELEEQYRRTKPPELVARTIFKRPVSGEPMCYDTAQS